MTNLTGALAWADHKKAAVVSAHILAAEVRSLQAWVKELEAEKAEWDAYFAKWGDRPKKLVAENADLRRQLESQAIDPNSRENLCQENAMLRNDLEVMKAKLSTAKADGRRWQDKFDHLNHAVYEAYTQSVISAPTQENLCKAQSWEPEAQAKGGA